jgi:polysaccharide biosynthesis transport protein
MTEHQNLPAPRVGPAPMEAVESYYGSEPGLDGQQQHGPMSLKRVLQSGMRYRWLIVGIFAAGTVGSLIATRYVTYRYAAESTFWFDVASTGEQTRGPIASSGLLQNDAWIELLRSYSVLDYVVREERLFLEHSSSDASLFANFQIDNMFRPGDYTFVIDPETKTGELRTKEGMAVDRVAAGDPVGARMGFRWQPSTAEYTQKRSVAFTVLTPRDASKELSNQLITRMARGGNFMAVSYTATNAQQAADVVNTLGTRYVDVAAELKSYRSTTLRDALENQLVAAQVNLAQAEMQLENFRISTITLPTDAGAGTPVAPGSEYTRAPVINAFFTLKIERELVQRDRDALARLIDVTAADTLSVDAFSTIGSAQNTPELRQALADLTAKRAELRAIRQQLTDEHPTARRAMADVETLEREVVPALTRRVVGNLDARAATLDDLIRSSGGELQSIPPRVIEEARLRRAVAIAETMYNDLRQRYEGARLAAETSLPDVRIHDYATVPTRPTSDPRVTVVLIGVLGSLGLGVLLAVMLDRVDPRLRYAEQVTDGMRLPVIGAVPHLSGVGRGLLSSDESARVLESLRAIRLNLMYAHGNAGPIMVTVSSPGSGDGKTFVSSNLALTFADLGLKTLIIDGDTRRGGLHHLYSVSRRPGLTDFLAGDVPADGIIKPTQYPLVSVLTGGSRRSDSPELLSSDRLGDLLAQIRNDYQVIIVDSPPLGAGIDPLILATLTGSMLLVMRRGKTDRVMAEAKLHMLDRMPIRLLGVILNGLDESSSYRYYSYMAGYEVLPEEPETEPKILQPV